MKKAITLNTQTIVKRLEEAGEGEIITYQELSGLIDTDVQNEGRGSLNTARKKVRSDHDMVFRTLMGIGVQRCVEDEKVGEIEKQRRRARSAAKEGVKIQRAIEYEKLSEDTKAQYNINCSVVRGIELFTKPASVKKIQQAVMNNRTMIDLDGITRLFSK